MVLSTIVSVSATVFAALRIYALFNRSQILFVFVLSFGLLSPTIFVFLFTKLSPAPVAAIQGCSLNIVGNVRSFENWSMLARAASVLSDGIVLVLTWMKRRLKRRDIAEPSDPDATVRVLFRDSSRCFAFLCIINIIGIGAARRTEFIQITQTWTSILTSVLMSRLALDLLETSRPDIAGATWPSLALDTMIFAEDIHSAGSEETAIAPLDNTDR
ncbi:hypothetical protein DAEQUDRAFT_725880 [Daedalea quercina L-15889]|uniref:Uncharacterized protein n=1 Tax=Daedalea quercina L-15889 TaxID=1314783 RepID=A0A165QTL2_9APHY|nr:hypothetical protein DAEQUDRAFT_725880 [Daedalea quercina L-15889]